MAEAVLARIAALYAIEKEIRGADAPARQTTRNERSRPLVAELERFLREQAARLSPGSEMGKAIAYLLNHWDGLTLFLDDGCVEMRAGPGCLDSAPLDLSGFLPGYAERGALRFCRCVGRA
ncbi:transposase [Bradyrhizobium diazoefficiens]|nr:transposase [Bradyrhizobium diazoefficiens]WLA69217.1 transposase [Bradyrhizobium diazoefficiens]